MTPEERKALTTAIKYLAESKKTRAVDANLVIAGCGSPSMHKRAEQYQEIAAAIREMQAMLMQSEMDL